MVKDRQSLFIVPLTEQEERIYYVENSENELFEPLSLVVEKIPVSEFKLNKSPNVACLDLNLLEFPLLIRKWQQGDYFYPFGMKGKKKISKFFKDEKLSLPQKENCWLLCSGQDIVWVINYRADARFAVGDSTREILRLSYTP